MSLILDPPLASLAIVTAGEKKSSLPFGSMSILGFLAGFFLAFGGQVAFTVLTSGVTDPTVADPTHGVLKWFAGLTFSCGLLVIIICGAELFTGNCLIIMAVLSGKVTVLAMLWDWLVVYSTNYLGSIVTASLVYGSDLVGGYDFSDMQWKYNSSDPSSASKMYLGTVGRTVCKVAVGKAKLIDQPGAAFMRGILANVLVCLAVLAATASKSATGKTLVIIMCISTFVASGFEHSIANMYTFTLAAFLRCPDFEGADWVPELILATLGNIVGAAILAFSYSYVYIPREDQTLHIVPVAEASTHKDMQHKTVHSPGDDQENAAAPNVLNPLFSQQVVGDNNASPDASPKLPAERGAGDGGGAGDDDNTAAAVSPQEGRE